MQQPDDFSSSEKPAEPTERDGLLEDPAEHFRGSGLLGRTEPRLFTEPLRPLTRETTRGFELIEFADLIGEPFLPWQRWLAIHALELLPDGNYRYRVILVLVARQNGKSTLKRTVSLWRLYMDGAKLILGTAQDVSLAREQWTMALDTIHACPDLAAEHDTTRRVNGDEWFRLTNGGRYKIAAANRKAGRGLSVDELTIDELRVQRSWDAWSSLSKTTSARPNGQIWAMSNAGDDESIVLNQLRSAALADRDPSIGIFEWSAPDGCELDDPAAWVQANPALGITLSEAAVRSSLSTDPPNVFRAEVLCQKVDQLDGAIDLGGWKACADPSGTMADVKDRLVACFDVAPDGLHATLVAGGLLADGRVRVAVVKAWKSADVARAELEDVLTELKPTSIAWYPTGPGAAFVPILRPEKGEKLPGGVESVELTGMKVAEACQGLSGIVDARQILHQADPLIDAHIGGAQKLPSGDGYRFVRRGAGHVDAAYGVAGVAYIALTAPPAAKPRIRMVG